MESFSLQADKTIRYQPLQSTEDENCGISKDNSLNFSSRSSWSWVPMDISNDYKGGTMKRISASFKALGFEKKSNRRAGIYCCFFSFLTMGIVVLTLLSYVVIKTAYETSIDATDPNEQRIVCFKDASISSSDDSLMEDWEKYADRFFSFDGLGTRVVYTSPMSNLSCEQPGGITILINSTKEQNWKDFKTDKTCSEILVIQRLELSGIFSNEDLRHILNEIPNIASLKISAIALVKSYETSEEIHQENIVAPILTSLSIVEAIGEDGTPIFDWVDKEVEMPFLSEILIMKSDIVVAPVNNIVRKSENLISLFLIGNSIVCNQMCPSFATEMNSLIELVLINGNDELNGFWGHFINSMLLKVKDDKALRILETNIPTNVTVVEILINSELASENRQVYEIAFRLPSMGTLSKNAFVERQVNLFEKYYSNGDCSKGTVEKTSLQLWVNLCQDSQHSIMYGTKKAKFIQNSHLTIFIRRAQKGNVVCYNDISHSKISTIKEEFSCQNYFDA